MKCCKCGKNMEFKVGDNYVGVSMKFTIPEYMASKERITFLKEQLGKYEMDVDYDFCYECWLDALFNGKD